MQGQWSHEQAYYRCRFPNEYALANKVSHPRNICVKEGDVLPELDKWLGLLFAPNHIDVTIEAMFAAQADGIEMPSRDAAATIADCDAKLARYRDALEAGTDPNLVTRWTAEVQAKKAEAMAGARRATGAQRMTKDEIANLVQTVGNIRTILTDAAPAD